RRLGAARRRRHRPPRRAADRPAPARGPELGLGAAMTTSTESQSRTGTPVTDPTPVTTADLHADAVHLLSQWVPDDKDQQSLVQAYLSFLAARPDAMQRSCAPGHLTASVVVLSADRTQTLLTLHPRVGRWLQLGGHHEPGDESVAAAALREGTEESGIDGLVLDPVPVRLDVHPITCSGGVPTRHLDVQFRAFAP